MITVSDYIADFLDAQGVECVFELIGGMITLMIDSLHTRGKIRLVSVHHEQAAAFAAEGFARISGVPGVAMATSGPGAVNLLTGIGSCYFDSTPAVFITGQVNTFELKGDRQVRQLGFQETDIVSMAKSITKAAWRAESAIEVPSLLEKAFSLALSGRPGPVLLDIPMDLQKTQISVPVPAKISQIRVQETKHQLIEQMLTDLQAARRPLIVAGGGLRTARVVEQFRNLVQILGVPVVNSLMAVDVLPAAHPLRVGLLGSYGNRWSNYAVGLSDFLLVLGSRLDIRQTGADTDAFKAGRTIYHVDCESGEVNNRVIGCHEIITDLQSFVPAVLESVTGRTFSLYGEWMMEIAEKRDEWPDTMELQGVPGINPNHFMHQLSAVSTKASTYIIDVGQHQMWACQSLQLCGNQRLLTSGGMGAMGFALPAAMGAVLADAKNPVLVVAGDGGFQLNIQELQTVARNQLPIKMVILNNHCHGMVRQFQQSYFEERYQSTYWGYSAPDFTNVANAYGIDACSVESPSDVSVGLERMWSNPDAPFLLEVVINTLANAYPKIAFGYPLTEMEPNVKPIAMEST